MSSNLSLGPAVDPPLHRKETLQIAALLAFASGYVDGYTWIIHGVLANQGREVGMFRRSGLSAGLVVSFGTGAGVGAFMTKQAPALAIGIPGIVLLFVLLRRETERMMGRFP
jgi:uncharacterized membrane protein YoaK (UPF0700 family)